MKNLITILIMFVAAGCGKTEVETKAEIKSDIEKLEAENKKLEAELKEEKRKLDSAAKNKKLMLQSMAENKKLTAEEEKLVGSYEAKIGDTTLKLVFFENGKSEFSENGEKKKDGTWEMPLLRFELGKEVHVGYENSKSFYKIEPNGDLTEIANIVDGEREEVQRVQTTFTKIK